jgi:hypothetical protein
MQFVCVSTPNILSAPQCPCTPATDAAAHCYRAVGVTSSDDQSSGCELLRARARGGVRGKGEGGSRTCWLCIDRVAIVECAHRGVNFPAPPHRSWGRLTRVGTEWLCVVWPAPHEYAISRATKPPAAHTPLRVGERPRERGLQHPKAARAWVHLHAVPPFFRRRSQAQNRTSRFFKKTRTPHRRGVSEGVGGLRGLLPRRR